MKNIIIVLVFTLSILSCKTATKKSDIDASKEQASSEKKVLSPHTSAMAMIQDAHIHLEYSSPRVRGRIIFGGLVRYESVWQAGAHNATWIETNKALTIAGETLPAGKYGFFTIPSKEDWTILINKNWNQHGKDDYDAADDVIRFKVTPSISDEIKEQLEYKVTKISETEGAISLSWEKVSIRFPFKINQ